MNMNSVETAKAKCNHRLTQMTQIGLIALIVVLGVDFCHRDTENTEIEIVIVKAPEKPRHPFQTEYEEMLYPAVRITAGFSTGTGVAIDDYILTAAHVVGDESTVEIETTNEHGLTRINASVVITDTTRDLALLKPQINTDSTDKIYMAHLARRDYTPYIFTPVYAVGCSLGLNPRPSAGNITAINNDSWEVSSPILPGNSGGPVYNARTYEVIGIAVWVKVYDGQLITTMAGIVPINQIYEFLQNYERTKEPKNERTQ